MEPDDLLLPDPSDATDEVARPTSARHHTRVLIDAWPFCTLDTILLGLLYVAPFAIGWFTRS